GRVKRERAFPAHVVGGVNRGAGPRVHVAPGPGGLDLLSDLEVSVGGVVVAHPRGAVPIKTDRRAELTKVAGAVEHRARPRGDGATLTTGHAIPGHHLVEVGH